MKDSWLRARGVSSTAKRVYLVAESPHSIFRSRKFQRRSVLAPALALALALALAPAAAAAAEASLAAGPPAPNSLYLRRKAHIIVFEEQPKKIKKGT